MMSAEDAAAYDRMEADVVNLGREIERLERQSAIDRELSQPVGKPLTARPEPGADQGKTGTATDEYKAAFWRTMRAKSVPHEVVNALQVGVESEGGYLAPDEYQRTLIEALEEQNIFRQLAHVISTSSGDRKIPVVASKGTASWIDEEAAYPESDDSFGQVSIGAYKLATMIKVSEELLNDSVFDLPSYIAREFARRIGAAEEEAFFTGNGTGKPTGVLNATGGAETGVTAASATAITMDEVMDLYYSLRAPYRRNAVFIMNDSTIKAIRKLKNGNGDYLWQPSLTAGQPDTLLGRPVYTSSYMPAIAAGNKDYPVRRPRLLLGGRPAGPLLQAAERALRRHRAGGLPRLAARGRQTGTGRGGEGTGAEKRLTAMKARDQYERLPDPELHRPRRKRDGHRGKIDVPARRGGRGPRSAVALRAAAAAACAGRQAWPRPSPRSRTISTRCCPNCAPLA